MEELLSALRAAGESTRLRILAVLARSELTVGELCRVLGQTQPRVSRHLRLLCEAGLLERHTQGTSAFYRPTRTGTGRRLFDAVLDLIDRDDPQLGGDIRRLGAIRAERAEAAAAHFEAIAADWDRIRARHVADTEVEAAMFDAVADLEVRQLVDVGTGTGRVLELFAPHIEHGLGLDLSQQMLDLARSRLDQLGHRHCAVRQANAYDLGVETGSTDVAVLHHVLHYLDDPSASIAEAARVLRPGGRLVIVDFAPHDDESMRSEHAHHWLGFADDEVVAWCQEAGLVDVTVRHLTLADDSETTTDTTTETGGQTPAATGTSVAAKSPDRFTVALWVAAQNPTAPAYYPLEAAS